MSFWLRALRQAPDNKNVRFLIAGSIGIGHVLSRLNETKSINNFENLRLEPFSVSVADAFLQELGEGARIRLLDEVRRKMLDLVGTPIPFFLQLLFSEVSTQHRLDKAAVTAAGVEQIYHEVVLGVACKTYFEHYYGRLQYYYQKPSDKAIKRMLRQMAVDAFLTRDVCYQLFFEETGVHADPDDFDRLMTNLENDFYIRFDQKLAGYCFSCKILRDWWLRHYAR